MTNRRFAWKRAVTGALLASVVGAELVSESHDSSVLARGSDSLAVYASCGAAAQGAALALAAVSWGAALGLRGLSWWKGAALAALGFAVLLLAVNTIGHDGKEEVFVEHVALVRAAQLSLHGEDPVTCRNGAVTFTVSQNGRSAVLFRGIPPWRVDTGWLFEGGICPAPPDGTPPPPTSDPWATASWSDAPLAWASVTAASSKARGARWSTRSAGTTDALRAVFGTSRSDVWIGSDGGELLRTQDGGRTFWRADIGEDIVSLWGDGPDDVWVLGKRHAYRVRGGTRLARLSVEGDFSRIAGTSATDVWIAAGELLHTSDGGATFQHVDPDPHVRRTDEVWASSASDVWATVPFLVVHSGDGGRTWARTSLAISSEDDFRLRGSPTDLWIIGYRLGPSRSTDGGLTWHEEGPPAVTD
ncbi:MAG TPA: hypothetical protein VIF09_24175, partial [Polyangiaceae bacterium]